MKNKSKKKVKNITIFACSKNNSYEYSNDTM